MGILRDTIDGDGLGADPTPDAPTRRLPPVLAPPDAGTPAPGAPGALTPSATTVAPQAPIASGAPSPLANTPSRSELERRRDELAQQVTELHWDLGGLAYEMAIRDHFRLDVLIRRAAVLQERDAELAELERLLRMEREGVAGHCPECDAPHSRGALFCWQCGATLMERLPSSATNRDE